MQDARPSAARGGRRRSTSTASAEPERAGGFRTGRATEDPGMDIRVRDLHYRRVDTPCELVLVDEVPNPEPPPHPDPADPPPTAREPADEDVSAVPSARQRA